MNSKHKKHGTLRRTFLVTGRVTEVTETRPNVALMLVQSQRRWPNIKTTMTQHFVFNWMKLKKIYDNSMGKRERWII